MTRANCGEGHTEMHGPLGCLPNEDLAADWHEALTRLAISRVARIVPVLHSLPAAGWRLSTMMGQAFESVAFPVHQILRTRCLCEASFKVGGTLLVNDESLFKSLISGCRSGDDISQQLPIIRRRHLRLPRSPERRGFG